MLNYQRVGGKIGKKLLAILDNLAESNISQADFSDFLVAVDQPDLSPAFPVSPVTPFAIHSTNSLLSS